jgi:hypothetical protein
MVEARWRRRLGLGTVALALLGGAGSAAVAAGPWWDPPGCAGGPGALVAAARSQAADPGHTGPAPWSESTPLLDSTGTLTGYRLVVGVGPDRHRLDLPPESFVAGPFGRLVLVGADDGRRSRVRAIDVAAGCAWHLADEAAVIRRATIAPDGAWMVEMRVDRTTRADLGIWRRPLDRSVPPSRILAPLPADGRFGRTWSTEFAWSVDGDRVAVQSCGLAACRTRLLDPGTASADLVAEPDLGPIVGLTRDRLVTYLACRGEPCPIVSIDLATRRRSIVSSAAGRAIVTGRGSDVRIVHEWRDATGSTRLRSVDATGGQPVDLGARGLGPSILDPRSHAPEVSR